MVCTSSHLPTVFSKVITGFAMPPDHDKQDSLGSRWGPSDLSAFVRMRTAISETDSHKTAKTSQEFFRLKVLTHTGASSISAEFLVSSSSSPPVSVGSMLDEVAICSAFLPCVFFECAAGAWCLLRSSNLAMVCSWMRWRMRCALVMRSLKTRCTAWWNSTRKSFRARLAWSFDSLEMIAKAACTMTPVTRFKMPKPAITVKRTPRG
mmetsp:Transcript_8142/g.23228  ORF Transcript_8142/g.23228 Transcript_8142/m.23228 type:complete len:207 (-) Transcript_8142:152-772(-)